MPSQLLSRADGQESDVVIAGVPYGFQGDCDDGTWLTADQIDELQRIIPTHRVVHCAADDLADLLKRGELRPDILFVETTGVEESYLDIPWLIGLDDFRELAASARWIHMCSAGVEHVLPVITDDVVLTNASGVHAPAIAESVLAAIFYNSRCLAERLVNQQKKAWEPLSCTELAGQKILIIGTGSIGAAVAQRASALGMECIGVNRNGRPVEHFAATVPSRELTSVVHDMDYVVAACPLTRETHHLLSRPLLEQLKPGCFVINISRGDLIDEQALIDLLDGPIGPGGAYLDAFSTEPLPSEHRAWEAPGLLLTPHDAHSSNLLGDRQFDLFRRNAKHFSLGEDLENVVDRSAGY